MHSNILDRNVNEDEIKENDEVENREVILMNQSAIQSQPRAVEGRILLHCTTLRRPTITVGHAP
jgi:hypothetical protein